MLTLGMGKSLVDLSSSKALALPSITIMKGFAPQELIDDEGGRV